MDVVASPLLTIIVNIIAQALVAKGILDAHTKDTFVQLVNNAIVSIGTGVIGLYSIYKIVDLHKHSITTKATQNTLTMTTPISDVPLSPVQISQPASQKHLTDQSGMPMSNQTTQTPQSVA